MKKSDGILKKLVSDSFIGGVVVFLAMVLLNGSISDAIAIIGISIICTAGIGAIFWIVLSVVVGKVVMAVVHGCMRLGYSSKLDNVTSDDVYVSTEMTVVVNYIKEARNSKIDDETITGNLTRSGWPDALVKDAFQRV